MESTDSCKEIAGQLDAYRDGELQDKARTDVERHLHSCSDCGKRLSATSRLVASLKTLPYPNLPAGLSAKLDAIAERPAGNVVAFNKVALAAACAAAVVVLLLAASLALRSPVMTALVKPGKQKHGEQPIVKPADGAPERVLQSLPAVANGLPLKLDQASAQHSKAAGGSNLKVAAGTPPAVPVAQPPTIADERVAESPARSLPLEQLQEPAQEEPGFRSIAELPSEKSSFETLGVATDEDGLYDIQM